MRGPRVAAAVVVVVALLLATQLAFTTVGRELGANWAGPTEVASVESSPETTVSDVAVAGGDAGAIAWIERHGERHVVRVARFEVTDGRVVVGERRTVARADRDLTGVGVARADREVAVVWEVAVADRVRMVRIAPSRTERLTAAASFRLNGPSVAYAAGEPVIAWAGQPDVGAPFGVYAARPGGEPVRVGGPTNREHAPSVTAADGRVGVTWFESAESRVVVTRLRADDGLSVVGSTVAGEAQVRGAFGGSVREVPFTASARNRSVVRVVWTDLGEVTTATVSAEGTASEPAVVTSFGGETGVGVDGDRWLATWTVPGGPTGDDAHYVDGAGRSGALARLPGNENEPSPVYAPDPAVAWYSWGGDARVLIAAYQPGGNLGVVARLAASPERFAFLAVAALALGVVTLPIMPWSFVGFLGAFLLTTGAVGGRLLRLGARATGAESQRALRDRVEALPTAVWPVLFAAVEIPLTWWLVFRWSALVSIGFAHPVAASVGALAAALLVVAALGIESGWRAVAAYATLQNAALWSIAAATFL